MIKRIANILFLVTALFIAFTLGFFTGRNFGASPVQISVLPANASAATQPQDLLFHAPSETEAPTETAVPGVTELPDVSPASDEEGTEDISGLININTATVDQLMTLPGIGEVLAQRIVDYREANGPFPSVAALTNVSGIGEKRLANLIHLITI